MLVTGSSVFLRLLIGAIALNGLLSISGCETKQPAARLPEQPQARRPPQPALRYDSLAADSLARLGQQLPGALLPGHRIVAFYGNPLHQRMGILGQYPKDEMLERLRWQAEQWQQADSLPVQPALHLIAVIAQRDAGPDRKYRLSLPDSTIRQVIGWGRALGYPVFLDVQVGLSTLPEELPRLEQYLQLPFVHLGIDPEFSMKNKRRPGTEVGEFSARDVNYARHFLATLVTRYRLPPKLLVVHRFREDMITNYQQIKLEPRVQIVVDMDGWGTPSIKRGSYRKFVQQQPVQYTGFKLFYKNDTKPGSRLMTPAEVLKLRPKPLYIQYQ